MSLAPSPTPLNLLTGFLGSGKTTLLAHLLTHGLAGRKVALLLNELGEAGLEPPPGGPQQAENFSFTELASGCVCCTVNTELRAALDELLIKLEPELVVLETTGVADPHALLLSLRGARCRVELLACVIDAANFETARQQSPVVATQAREADLLILNKTDLVSPEGLTALKAALDELNPRAPQVETTRGRVDMEGLLGYLREPVSVPRPQPAPLVSEEGTHGFTTLTLTTPAIDNAALAAFLEGLPAEVCRVKGTVHFPEGPQSLQYSFGRWELEPAPMGTPTRLLLIGVGKEWQPVATALAHRLGKISPHR